MAIRVEVLQPPQASADDYLAVAKEMDVAGNPPDGLIFHSAGVQEGQVRIVDVWESREQFDRFRQERLFPALMKVVGEERLAQTGGPVEPTVTELINFVKP